MYGSVVYGNPPQGLLMHTFDFDNKQDIDWMIAYFTWYLLQPAMLH